MPTIADFSLATLEKLLWSIGNADASVFDEVPTDTLVMASQQLKKAKTEDEDGPTLIIHLDLNKTILSVDEVKGYGREEVVYLEESRATSTSCRGRRRSTAPTPRTPTRGSPS